VTQNPTSITVSAGEPASFTASATGSPTIRVQWQVSSDGGVTFSNITGNASAPSTTLIFYTQVSENGYKYRAVFTNSAGTATSSAATLTVEMDNALDLRALNTADKKRSAAILGLGDS
jgi:hypothetical protein